MHARMNEKRIRKLNPLKARRDLFDVYGDPYAAVGVIAWGSVAGVAREALRRAEQHGIHAKLLVPRLLYPVAQQVYEEFFASVRAGFVVEQSHQGQLFRLIRMYRGHAEGHGVVRAQRIESVHADSRSSSGCATCGGACSARACRSSRPQID